MRTCPTCKAVYRGEPETCPLDGTRVVFASHSLVGSSVARWRIVEHVRDDTFRARHEVLGVHRALRVSSDRGALVECARTMAALGHPALPDVFEVIVDGDGRAWLAFEELPGATLEDCVPDGGARPEWAASVLRPVADLLACAHARGLTHGALCADVLHIRQSDDAIRVKVDRFGERRTSDGGPIEVKPLDRWGAVPVELFAGRKSPDPADDVYALGWLLYGSLTGRPPYESLVELARARQEASLPESAGPASLLFELARAMLHPDPARRPTARAVADVM